MGNLWKSRNFQKTCIHLWSAPNSIRNFARGRSRHIRSSRRSSKRRLKGFQKENRLLLRKREDSNLRWGFPHAAFRVRCLRPLSHASFGKTLALFANSSKKTYDACTFSFSEKTALSSSG